MGSLAASRYMLLGGRDFSAEKSLRFAPSRCKDPLKAHTALPSRSAFALARQIDMVHIVHDILNT